MRRMLVWIFVVGSLLSGILFASLWIFSYHRWGMVRWGARDNQERRVTWVGMESYKGIFFFQYQQTIYPTATSLDRYLTWRPEWVRTGWTLQWLPRSPSTGFPPPSYGSLGGAIHNRYRVAWVNGVYWYNNRHDQPCGDVGTRSLCRDIVLAVPLWFAAIGFTLLGGIPCYIAIRRRYRVRRRQLSGLCVTCGYDVRATAERCPECGQQCVRNSAGTTWGDAGPTVSPLSTRTTLPAAGQTVPICQAFISSTTIVKG